MNNLVVIQSDYLCSIGFMPPEMCLGTFHGGGGRLRHFDHLLLPKKVTEDTVTTSLMAWQTFDQLCCNFDNIRGHDPPYRHIPACLLRGISTYRKFSADRNGKENFPRKGTENFP